MSLKKEASFGKYLQYHIILCLLHSYCMCMCPVNHILIYTFYIFFNKMFINQTNLPYG